MPAGSAQLAKRALVTLLLILARKYDIPAVVINRDSPDGVVLATFKKVSRRRNDTDRVSASRSI